MLIRGQANGASIELSERDRLNRAKGTEYYRATLRENDFRASLKVYAFDPRARLSEFLESLAVDWKGWDGARSWSSLEGEFQLNCTHDVLRHINIEATLHSNAHGNGWTAQIRFEVTACDLEQIAYDSVRFFAT